MEWKLNLQFDAIQIKAGFFERNLSKSQHNLTTKEIRIQSNHIKIQEIPEFAFQISFAHPNERPIGFSADYQGMIEQRNEDQQNTDGLKISVNNLLLSQKQNQISWQDPIQISSINMAGRYQSFSVDQDEAKLSNGQLILSLGCEWTEAKNEILKGVSITQYYEIYPGFPCIRKWMRIQNRGTRWLKIENLILDFGGFSECLPMQASFTPEERSATSSIIGRTDASQTYGLILGNEIPSAIRKMDKDGSMGYEPTLFEWILGPNEKFESEPVFQFAFSGDVFSTISAISYPLDRAIESIFQEFLVKVLQIPSAHVSIPGPVYCTWSNLVAAINEENILELADIAAKCGFKTFQIDAGWSRSPDEKDWTAGGAEPHLKKFPNFQRMCEQIEGLGLKLGLWMSCFRTEQSKDLKDLPNARSIPLVKRNHGFGMAYASNWKEYYANDLIGLRDSVKATYFKQDLTNIKFGDFAEGHDNRSLKESYLRGLRGFLSSQKHIHQLRPDVWLQMSHELYWGTPGPGSDLAAIKHLCGVHIPPNDYSGCGLRRERWNPKWKSPLGSVKIFLRKGCWNARRRFYVHRGLPLYTAEYYGAATINIAKSLTSKIQDRQICSWLMGMPSVYAGDLVSLTAENIEHYRKRFQLLEHLEEKYGIYRFFQFSGVPEPTDKAWHWWGKINREGEGIVVVIRGGGLIGNPNIRKINISWIDTTRLYHVRLCFQNKDFGLISGEELQNQGIKLKLARWGQEILEFTLEK